MKCKITAFRTHSPMYLLSLLAMFLNCGGDPSGPERPELVMESTFESGLDGWMAGFADLAIDFDRGSYALTFQHTSLPAPLPPTRKGLFLSGYNMDDDLFMYVKRRIVGLEPDTVFRLIFRIQVATNAPRGCAGVGGAPGESVYLKAGAAAVEPDSVVVDDWYRMNLDKGNQATGGCNAVVIGHIAGTNTDCLNPVYELKDLDNQGEPLEIRSGVDGSLWVFVGTDSGFESTTAIYYNKIEIEFIRR